MATGRLVSVGLQPTPGAATCSILPVAKARGWREELSLKAWRPVLLLVAQLVQSSGATRSALSKLLSAVPPTYNRSFKMKEPRVLEYKEVIGIKEGS